MLQIGKYVPAHNGREALIQREFYEQGYIVKDEAAYRSHPERVCYVPELSDTPYTHNDLLALCDGQEALARMCFDCLQATQPAKPMSAGKRLCRRAEFYRFARGMAAHGGGLQSGRTTHCGLSQSGRRYARRI